MPAWPPAPWIPVDAVAAAVAAPPRRRRLRIAGATLATLAILVVPTGGYLYLHLARGTGDVLVDRAIPASVAAYATIRLDPSLGTKQHIRDLVNRFPASRGDAGSVVSRAVDGVLAGSGLTYDRDVSPWLGTQVAMIGTVSATESGGALLVVDTDDARAAATMRAAESGPGGRGLTWSDQTVDGVGVRTGSCPGSCAQAWSWAVVDHLVVLGSASTVGDVIQTDHGHQPALGAQQQYRDTAAQLPGDRVAEVYVAARPLLDALHRSLAGTDSATRAVVEKMVAPLDAYRSAGLAVSVQSDRADLDMVTLTDPARQPAPGPGGTELASWLPASTVVLGAGSTQSSSSGAGALAVIGLLSVVGTRTDAGTFQNIPNGLPIPSGSGTNPTPAPVPTARPSAQAVPGATVTDPLDPGSLARGLGIDPADLSHLTGPVAAGMWPVAGGPPRGALLIRADDSAALGRMLDAVLSSLAPGALKQAPIIEGSATIVSLGASAPAYAIVGGVGIVGSSVNAVRDVIDTHDGRPPVTDTSAYRGSGAPAAEDGVVFADVQTMVAMIRSWLPAADRSGYDGAAAGVAPLRTVTAASSGDRSVQRVRIEVVVG